MEDNLNIVIKINLVKCILLFFVYLSWFWRDYSAVATLSEESGSVLSPCAIAPFLR